MNSELVSSSGLLANMDYTYILVIIGAVISLLASLRVKITYKRFSKVASSRGITSEQAAQAILQSAGINDVQIGRVSGNLTDFYSPKDKILKLSDSVSGSTSVAAIGVAAHECGHAIQHNVGYGPLKLRSAAVPVAKFGSYLSWPVILIGLWLGRTNIAQLGVVLFLAVVAFQIVTLPVEFNASRRALEVLDKQGMLVDNELRGAKKVLKAAALTYVAAVFTSILQLLRLILIVKGGGKSRRSR